MGSAPLIAHGAAVQPTKWAVISTNRFFTGLWTQRNPLRDAATQYLIEKFYAGARYDSLIGGLNIELTNRLSLRRRPGHSIYNTQTFPAIQRFYEFRQVVQNVENISIIADTATSIYDATGPSTQTLIFTKAAGAGQSYFQSVGNQLFIGDGLDAIKYYKPQTGTSYLTQNWTIAMGGNSSGPTIATTGTNNPAGGGTAWTNPNNVGSAVAFATVTLATKPTSSQLLNVAGFGFAIPAGARIVGFQVSLNAGCTVAGGLMGVSMLTQFGSYGTTKNVNVATPGPTGVILGGSSDLWGSGVTWTPAMVNNNANFGVVLSAIDTSHAPSTFEVNNVQITVFYTTSPALAVNGVGLTGSYGYVYCYGNSLDNAVSSPSLPNSITLANQGVQISLVASPDPQCNHIRVFRTTTQPSLTAALGGPFFELPTSPYPNTTGNVVDNAADNTLSIFSQAPNQRQNDPPPAGFRPMAYHCGRIWGFAGTTLVYSNGPDTIIGNRQTGFNPTNNFVFPSLGMACVPTALGMIVFTTSEAYFVGGSGTAQDPFRQPVKFLAGKAVGLLNYNNLEVNGSLIYMRNSKGKLLLIDLSSGISEAGFPIGDVLVSTAAIPFPASAGNVAWHESDSTDSAVYVTDGLGNWYRMNPTPAPETGITWSPLGSIAGGFSAVQSVETSPGVHQLLLGPPAATPGPILFRDPTTRQDNGVSFVMNVQIGSIVLAHTGQVAELGHITTDCTAVGSRPTVSVLLNEISGIFDLLPKRIPDPPDLPQAVSLYNDRWYFDESEDPAICRHLQIQFAWPAENAANELLTYAIWGAQYQEMEG